MITLFIQNPYSYHPLAEKLAKGAPLKLPEQCADWASRPFNNQTDFEKKLLAFKEEMGGKPHYFPFDDKVQYVFADTVYEKRQGTMSKREEVDMMMFGNQVSDIRSRENADLYDDDKEGNVEGEEEEISEEKKEKSERSKAERVVNVVRKRLDTVPIPEFVAMSVQVTQENCPVKVKPDFTSVEFPFFARNPVECILLLLKNPNFTGNFEYVPKCR